MLYRHAISTSALLLHVAAAARGRGDLQPLRAVLQALHHGRHRALQVRAAAAFLLLTQQSLLAVHDFHPFPLNFIDFH